MLGSSKLFLIPSVILGLRYASSTVQCEGDKSSAVKSELLKLLKREQLVFHEEELKARGKAWNSYHKSDVFPSMIVYPEW